MASEKLLDDKLCRGVKSLGGMALKMTCLTFTGIPDRTCLLPGGRVYFVELKTTGRKLSPRQEIVVPWLRKLGFEVWVIDTVEQLTEFIDKVKNDINVTH